MKIAAVVILYHADEKVLENIKTYYDYADKIFVFDNTEVASPETENLKELPKIVFLQDFENKGIAKRLNEACAMAQQENFDWMLTMDQDSRFSSESIINYFNYFYRYKNKENVAMFGTSFGRSSSTIFNDCPERNVDKLITSGSLLNLSLFEKTGEFDEALFIDSVDYDYCFRAKMAGFSLIQFSDIHLTHSVGHEVFRSCVKSLFLLKKKKEVHSPLRIYYMYRNMLYLKKKYKNDDKKYFAEIKCYVFSRLKVCMYYGRNTRQIFKYLAIARSDFKKNKMGKIETNRL